MKQSLFTLEHARQLTADTYELVLSGDTSAVTAPGQFVNIQLPGKFLRRPISICNWTEDALLLLVRVVGEGTHDLVRCVPRTELDVLSGLGNGFDLTLGGAHPILLGGGIGIAPLYGLAQRMLEAGITPTVGLGFRSGKDAFYLAEFSKLGCRLLVAADCTAYAYANFHQRFIRGHVTLVGCPKLDSVDYSEKLTEILMRNDVKSVTVVRMEVPCCGGIELAVKKALQASGKMIPWQVVTIGTNGTILDEL